MLRIGDGEADLDVVETSERDDLAGRRGLDVEAVQALEGKQFRDASALSARAVDWELPGVENRKQRHGVADVDFAALDATDAHAAEVGRIVDRRDQHLERSGRVVWRRWNVLDDGVEQG